jgi:hypothetical protein
MDRVAGMPRLRVGAGVPPNQPPFTRWLGQQFFLLHSGNVVDFLAIPWEGQGGVPPVFLRQKKSGSRRMSSSFDRTR